MSAVQMDRTTRVARCASALAAEVDGQTVALDVRNGICFGLDDVATRIWQMIEAPRSIGEICETLQDEFDVAPDVCEHDVRYLLSELIEAELASVA